MSEFNLHIAVKLIFRKNLADESIEKMNTEMEKKVCRIQNLIKSELYSKRYVFKSSQCLENFLYYL